MGYAGLLVILRSGYAAGWFAYDHAFTNFIGAALPHPHEPLDFNIGIAEFDHPAVAGIASAYAYARKLVTSVTRHVPAPCDV
jgi:hypothetical protein